MAKKRFVLFTLVAAFVFVATSGMTSCIAADGPVMGVHVDIDVLDVALFVVVLHVISHL